MIKSLAPAALSPEPIVSRDAKKAATELEGHFISYMLSQMQGENGMMGKGTGASTYQGMLETQLGDALAQTSPLGLRDIITQAMLGAEPARGGPEGLHITSGYGVRQHPVTGETAFHHGYDLQAEEGDKVFTPRAGTVVFSGENKGYGQMVEVRHDDGTSTRYAHLSTRSVSVGTQISASTEVGRVGQTGTTTGPHLHFEVRKNGESLEPGEWLKKSDFTVLGLASTVKGRGVRP